jgi:hypothetical protein
MREFNDSVNVRNTKLKKDGNFSKDSRKRIIANGSTEICVIK